MSDTTGRIDHRFSDRESAPTSWAETEQILRSAELYWFTSVRGDGRPHVAPLVGVFHEGAVHVVTGPESRRPATSWATTTSP